MWQPAVQHSQQSTTTKQLNSTKSVIYACQITRLVFWTSTGGWNNFLILQIRQHRTFPGLKILTIPEGRGARNDFELKKSYIKRAARRDGITSILMNVVFPVPFSPSITTIWESVNSPSTTVSLKFPCVLLIVGYLYRWYDSISSALSWVSAILKYNTNVRRTSKIG